MNFSHVLVTSCGLFVGTRSTLLITSTFHVCYVEMGSNHVDCCAHVYLSTHFFCHVSTPNYDLSFEVKCYHHGHGGCYVDVVTEICQGDYAKVKGFFHDETFDQGYDLVFCFLVMDDPQMQMVEKGFWALFDWFVPHCLF
jgi:hypothetical protein